MTKINTDRKAPVTHTNLLNAYLLAGSGEAGRAKVSAMLVNHTKPIETLDKVIGALEAADQDTEDLTALRDIFAAAKGNGVKGRKPPKSGDTKLYSAQEVNGDVFIRLPLVSMGVAKGEKLSVTFSDDQIVVCRRPSED